jgi:hypothetical protein
MRGTVSQQLDEQCVLHYAVVTQSSVAHDGMSDVLSPCRCAVST